MRIQPATLRFLTASGSEYRVNSATVVEGSGGLSFHGGVNGVGVRYHTTVNDQLLYNARHKYDMVVRSTAGPIQTISTQLVRTVRIQPPRTIGMDRTSRPTAPHGGRRSGSHSESGVLKTVLKKEDVQLASSSPPVRPLAALDCKPSSKRW